MYALHLLSRYFREFFYLFKLEKSRVWLCFRYRIIRSAKRCFFSRKSKLNYFKKWNFFENIIVHLLFATRPDVSSRLLKKVRPSCKYLKPRKYNEIRVIYLLSGRAVSCPFPRSIFMIKVFARTRSCTYTPPCWWSCSRIYQY